jgi:phosphate/sulfate permease
MENIYLVAVVVLFALAVFDLVVGVSNDAVNFLNSAIGSRVARRQVILLVATAGILIGSVFSSGMMEVARKGVFFPEMFAFDDLIMVFLAVMVADILLLDLFNTFGMPTSTTVSIVFELFGAAMVMALFKIGGSDASIGELGQYINGANAAKIIGGIFLSVLVAFTVGMAVQYLARLIFSFNLSRRAKWAGPIWGGFAMSVLTFFLFFKGIKGASFVTPEFIAYVGDHAVEVVAGSFLIFGGLFAVLAQFGVSVLRIVVLFGTFSLAMAFAGNDLVNFIGVSVAGLQAYQFWVVSGIPPELFTMDALSQAVRTESYLLIIAGLVMSATLWMSKKARSVTETEVKLARQSEGDERFVPGAMARGIVRGFRGVGYGLGLMIPKAVQSHVEQSFEPVQESDAPAFDLVRASVNLTAASALIAFATSLKMPLSTTYVSFMVAMGTSLADRAWDRESAVYRVSGVLSVVAGWLLTALAAFVAAGIFTAILKLAGIYALIFLVLLVAVSIGRSFLYHRQKLTEANEQDQLIQDLRESPASQAVVKLREAVLSDVRNVEKVVVRAVKYLGDEERGKLGKLAKRVKKMRKQSLQFKGYLYGLMQREPSNETRDFNQLYFKVYDQLIDLHGNADHILQLAYNHKENEHKPLIPEQCSELDGLLKAFESYQQRVFEVLEAEQWSAYPEIQEAKHLLFQQIDQLFLAQSTRVNQKRVSARNNTVFLEVLLELKDIISISGRFVRILGTAPPENASTQEMAETSA